MNLETERKHSNLHMRQSELQRYATVYLCYALTRNSDEDTPQRYGNSISSHAFPLTRQSSDCTCYFISYFYVPKFTNAFVHCGYKSGKTSNYECTTFNLNLVNNRFCCCRV